MSQTADRPPVTPAIFARSLAFLLGQALTTLLFAPIALLVAPLPFPWRFAIIARWSYFNLWWLGVTCGLRHTVEGLEHIPATPTIVLCKHESAWETLSLQRYFTPQTWVLKRELLRVPFFGWGLAVLKPIAIDRRAGVDAMQQIMEQGRQRLADRIWVVIFPEGTRVPPGERRRYKPGGAVLAARTGAPVVPVAHDSGTYWPRHSFIKWPGCIRLVIGPPIETRGRSAAEINRLAQTWIEGTMERLRPDPSTSEQAPTSQGSRSQ